MTTQSNGNVWIALLAGFVLGGLVIGGWMMWRFESRINDYFGKKRIEIHQGTQKSPFPRIQKRSKPETSRKMPVSKKKMDPLQKARFLRQWKEVQHNINTPNGGLLYRYKLLTAQDVQQLVKATPPVLASFLHGIPRSEFYDALHFTVKPTPKHVRGFFGLSAQLWWSKDIKALQSRWNRYKIRYKARSSKQSKKLQQVYFQKKSLLGVAAYWPRPNALLYMHCHTQFCTSSQLTQLTNLVGQRLQKRR